MAVIQISRIQVRRGLQDNIPSLASAELGWSLDTRRLHIGNGLTTEGAPITGRTEILTEHSDILALVNIFSFKALPTGFNASTGPSNTVYTRSLQEKLDDFVNVRDFGAKGDGVTDDTASITRALVNTFGYTSTYAGVSTRRTVYFPSGKYLVSSLINVPPFVTLVGDSADSTKILNSTSNTSATIFKFTDTNANVSTAFGDALGSITTRGRDYSFRNIGIQNQAPGINPCVLIAGGDKITFDSCKFEGPAASVVDPGTTHSAVFVENNTSNASFKANNIKFINCEFENHGYAIETLGDVKHILISGCTFSNIYKATVFSATTTNYTFDNNISVGVSGETTSQTFVESRGTKKNSTGAIKTIAANTTGTFTEVDLLDDYEHLTIDYVATVGTNKRIGKFRAVGTGSAYNFEDDYVETATLNFKIEANSSTGVITYSTTGAGSSATISYSVEYHS
jgi:hypothetical protein|tara:strand:- start:1087 stop:2448 length:1362 start_codon:yes stop_codon:yes gene_type:complete